MVAKGDDVAQQGFSLDTFAPVVNLYRAPIRLVSDQAVGFEHMAHQCFFNNGALRVSGAGEMVGIERIIRDLNIQSVNTFSLELAQRLSLKGIQRKQRHANLTLRTGGQIAR